MDYGSEGKIFGILSGRLSLGDIMQLLHATHSTATLTLEREGNRGTISFKAGEVVHTSVSHDDDTMIAKLSEIQGDKALLKLLGWVDAAFVIEEETASVREPTAFSDDAAPREDTNRAFPESRLSTGMETLIGPALAEPTLIEPSVLNAGPQAGEDKKDGLEVESRELFSMARQPERRKLSLPLVLILAAGILLPSAFFSARSCGKSRTSFTQSGPQHSPSSRGVEAASDPATTIGDGTAIAEADVE